MIGGTKVKDDVTRKLYSNQLYLDYLRQNPKWYYYLDLDPKYYDDFEKTAKKALKLTTYDKLEAVKNQINFASTMLKYFSNK